MRLLVCVLVVLGPLVAHAECNSDSTSEKRGWFWYAECPKQEPLNDEKQEFPDPGPLPSVQELMAMHPKELEKIHEQRKEWAIYKETPEAVKDYYIVTDVIRRKSLAFTALSKYVMMTNPELNSKSQYPTVNPARKVATQVRDHEVDTLINSRRNDYALALFTTQTCPYCAVQRGILKYFQDTHGWNVKEIDINANPELAARFNASTTPMTIMIERGTERWMPVSVGVESLPDIQNGVYRAIRMLSGEISPTQYLLDQDNQGGFFDPDAVPKTEK